MLPLLLSGRTKPIGPDKLLLVVKLHIREGVTLQKLSKHANKQ